MKKNIVLVGMMGCGKTTVGEELAKTLSEYNYVDIDIEIEKSTQKKISEIFLKHGEPFFRMLETEKILKFSNLEKQIISTGGGAFESEENRKNLMSNGVIIYLKTTPKTIFDRIKNETHRPLLRKDFSVEKIASIIKNRELNYKKADLIIDTDNKTPQDIVKEIIGAINE
ncbi:shikimate kinase [bacterium]|nr:shikimate kinase [bacterium]